MNPSDLLAALLQQLSEAVCFKDREGRYLRMNATLAAWLGLKDPEEAVGRTDADFWPKDFARTIGDADREVRSSGAAKTSEEKRVWPDGRAIWTSTTRSPLRDAAGNVAGTVVIFRDIGAELQARQEVRRAEILYRSLVDNLPQSFFRKDLEGRVVFANRRYCEVLGKSAKELLGKTDYDLFPEHLARKYREDDARVLQTGVTLDVVEAHKPPGKGIIHVRVVKTPVYDADKRAIGVQGIFWEVPAQVDAPPPEKKGRARKPAARRRAKPRRKKK